MTDDEVRHAKENSLRLRTAQMEKGRMGWNRALATPLLELSLKIKDL